MLRHLLHDGQGHFAQHSTTRCLMMLLIALCIGAQSLNLVVWQPGMDHLYRDGVLWMKAEAQDCASVAVGVSADSQYINVSLTVDSRSSTNLDILPDRFTLTLNEPQVLPLGHVLPEGNVVPESNAKSGILRATTVRPGQEVHGTVLFRQDPLCVRGEGCKALLTIPIETTAFIFPAAIGARATSSSAPLSGSLTAPLKPLPKGHDWKIGRVMDSFSGKEYFVNDGLVEMTFRDTELAVVGGGFAYVLKDFRVQGGTPTIPHAIVQVISNRHHGCRFIVNDDVVFYQSKSVLHVMDADSKECTVDILRQERLQPRKPGNQGAATSTGTRPIK